MSLSVHVEIRKGGRYYVTWAGRIEHARVLSVTKQEGAKIVRWRIGMPIVGTTVTETAGEFYKRMVKE